ncbi:MAG: DUF1573 domain-containing protein [Endomicrobiales bacterium]|nr:DUF1573 domain-containing protein [Endomicrobiales bacterium]
MNKAILTFLLFIPFNLYAQPDISISEPFWDFKSVEEGTILKEKLTISNTGSNDLQVNARATCECITLNFSSVSIKPGEKKDLDITFDTGGFSGKKTEYIFIDTNDQDSPNLTWLIEGTILSGAVQTDMEEKRPSPVKSDVQLVIEIYMTPSCKYCNKLKEKILPAMLKKHNVMAEIKSYFLNEPDNYERLVMMEKKYNDTNNNLPVVILGNTILGGEDELKERLEEQVILLKSYKPMSKESIFSDSLSIKQEISQRIKSLKILPVLAAGLLDGFNPCAFAGIVFLVAYLSMIKKRATSEVFWTGIMFVFGIFVVYFLIGIGLSKIFVAISALKYVSKVMYIGVGILTLILSYLSFSDYLALRAAEKGLKSKVVLQLPDSMKLRIRGFIERYGNAKYLVPFGFLLGVVVSFLEFFCTGQIYLPTIMYMVRIPELMAKAFFYLAIYSLMFVLPLLIIFASLLVSLKSGRLQALGRGQVKIVKLLTGVLFLALALFMFFI